MREKPEVSSSRIALVPAGTTAGTALSIALTRNKDVPNEDAFNVDEGNMVVYSAEAVTNTLNLEEALKLTARKGSSTGAVVVDTAFMRDTDWEPARGQLSLYRDVLGAALAKGSVAGFDNGHGFFMDIGTVLLCRP